jgi:hypothetical protein
VIWQQTAQRKNERKEGRKEEGKKGNFAIHRKLSADRLVQKDKVKEK